MPDWFVLESLNLRHLDLEEKQIFQGQSSQCVSVWIDLQVEFPCGSAWISHYLCFPSRIIFPEEAGP